MCGIVGYLGQKAAAPILIDGLRRLEYRGYDSAGLAIIEAGESEDAPENAKAPPGGLSILRAVGKLSNLADAAKDAPLDGTLGIGHTRWATHGRPNEANAHPHRSGHIAVVHNGIIENHLELKDELSGAGVKFQSDTDTEIVAHLVALAYARLEKECDLSQAATETLRLAVVESLARLSGAYALAVVSAHADDAIVVAKNASPLVIGVGKGEALCASDIPALLAHTRDVLFVEDGEHAVLRREGVQLFDSSSNQLRREPSRIAWSPVQAEKGGYKHFMLKEIFEQPRSIEDTIRGRIHLERASVESSEMGVTPEVARKIDRVYFVACGTSYHASLAGRYWIEKFARIPSQAELASEVRYRDPVFTSRDLVVVVSQSGETADSLAALQAAKSQGAQILSICNVVDSAIPRAADGVLYTHAGPEIGVASTKAFTTQLVAMLLLSIYLGRERDALPEKRARKLLESLLTVPGEIRRTLDRHDQVLAVARRWHKTDHILYLGRGLGFPVALEGALKLKEISYAHAEGYAAGEMKHGPIALIDENMPCVFVLPQDSNYEKTLSNLQEVKARDGKIIAVVSDSDERAKDLQAELLTIPDIDESVMPLVASIPLQLLSYYIADLKGTDVDQPRNLAKTVTVE